MCNGEICVKSVKQKKWIPFIRQAFVCSGVWSSFFIVGLCLGAPTVFIPQIRKEANSTEAITDETASWISSTASYVAIPWVFILTTVAQIFGRKVPMALTFLASLSGFTLLYYSTNLLHIFICNGLVSLSCASQLTTSIFILTEYTAPCNRGIFLTIKSASVFWGIWTANAIGTFFHWKNIGVIGVICSLYALFSVIFWPESPYWLAKKRRFEQCAKSHRWLKGCSVDSEHELEKILTVDTSNKRHSLRRFFNTFMAHKLYKSVFMSSSVIALYHFSGKLVCSIYIIDIIKKVTSSESTAYTGMLILDGVTVLSMYVGCAVSKFVNRRTQLIVSSSVAIMSLFVLSLYLYLIKKMIINENKILTLALLMIFSIFVCCGPIIMSTSISGELLPLKCRNFCVYIMALITNLLTALGLKFGPLFFKYFGLDGAFLFYGLCSSVLLFFIYVYLPETKDKTLQEIQDGLKGEPTRTHETVKLVIEIPKINDTS